MKDFIVRLVNDFNNYSKLVALNYAQLREGRNFDETALQWNRGTLNTIETYLKELADSTEGTHLTWLCEKHTFGFDDWTRVLEYRTVLVVFDN